MTYTYPKTHLAAALLGAVALLPLAALGDSVESNTHADSRTTVQVHTSGSSSYAATKVYVNGEKIVDSVTSGSDGEGNQGSMILDLRGNLDASSIHDAVEARVRLLEKLEDRITHMKRLSDSQKEALSAELSVQAHAFTEAMAKLKDGESTKSIIADVKAMHPEYRHLLLTLPKAALTAASGRVMTIAAQMEDFGEKLDARIDAAEDAGADVSAAEDAYADYTANIESARAHAQAALDILADLADDGAEGGAGSSASNSAESRAANFEALQEAHAELRAARADLMEARADMAVIMRAVAKGNGEGHVDATIHAQAEAS